MIRNVKTLALAVVAILAVSAMAAQAASAAAFNSEAAETTLTGSQTTTNEFSVTSGIVKCSKAEFDGTQVGTTAEMVVVHPSYSGCKLAGIAATVNTTGCNYTFEKTTGNTTEGIIADVVIECEAGHDISVTKEGCTVTVPGGQTLAHVKITNSSPETDVTINATVAGITYEEIGAPCASPGHHTNGTYTGSATIEGINKATSVMTKIWVA
jgi:phosphate-selective porin